MSLRPMPCSPATRFSCWNNSTGPMAVPSSRDRQLPASKPSSTAPVRRARPLDYATACTSPLPFIPGVFQQAALVTEMEDVAVTAVNVTLRVRYRDVELLGVGQRVLAAADAPLAQAQ